MINNPGYQKNLFILPFDHRNSFVKLLGFANPKLSFEEKEAITGYKELIYDAFKKAVGLGVPKDQAAILVDEEYGDKIIKDAKNNNYNVILAAEKSGQGEFTFEYGDDFAQHIEKYKPDFVKALVLYNENSNYEQLKMLSDYCHKNGYKFILEALTRNKTEKEAIAAIEKLQNSEIEPDIWKMEGMETEKEYENIVAKIQGPSRQNVNIVILGRGEKQPIVEKWIGIGSKVKGIIGFAVGRTIFWEPLTDYRNGNIGKEKAIEIICNNFLHFYHIFINKG
jgi:myo-inositol catabolism protein IolC